MNTDERRSHFFIKNNRYLLASLVCLMSIFIVSVVEFINVKEKNSTIRLSTTLIVFLVFILFFTGSFKNQLDFIYFQF